MIIYPHHYLNNTKLLQFDALFQVQTMVPVIWSGYLKTASGS